MCVQETGGRMSFFVITVCGWYISSSGWTGIREVKKHLEEKFGEVKFEKNNRLSYLGMQIKVTDEGTIIDMSFFVHQL